MRQNDQANREEILGAIMLLVYYEVVSNITPGLIIVAQIDHVLARTTRKF